MLIQSETFRPMIKAWSPMSLGAWALMGFGGCAFLSFAAVVTKRHMTRLVTVVGALLGSWRDVSAESLRALERFDASVLVLELVVIVALVASLGRIMMMVWLNEW